MLFISEFARRRIVLYLLHHVNNPVPLFRYFWLQVSLLIAAGEGSYWCKRIRDCL